MATRSPLRVTTAESLPSLPTPAAIFAPTPTRQSVLPLVASTATTSPSLEARVSMSPLTATVSGKRTAPTFWLQTGRTVIGAAIGSRSLALGLSELNSLPTVEL